MQRDGLTTLTKLLANKQWRLNNLYYIIDKEDNVVLLNLNHAQNEHFRQKHPKTITLKARQQGVSTYKVAENLDKCLFEENSQAGIQSYGLSESKKLSRKALFMWDRLDPDVKALIGVRLVGSNSEGFTFSNGSILKIGNFRGDTLSSLHVSELAKIAKKFPEKAEELNTGAFEAVSTNSAISIESTAEGKGGLFHEMWLTAVSRLDAVGVDGLTPLDFYPIFLSWMDDPDCFMHQFYGASEADEKYFAKVEEYTGRTLTDSQKHWASAKRARLRQKFDQEYPYCPTAAFDIPVEGTYYKVQYAELVSSGRIKPLTYQEHLPVFAIFDLGMNDEMCIDFVQLVNGVPSVIAEYSNNGEKISYYVEIMQQMPFPIEIVYLPHDANVTEMQTGRTRLEEFTRLGVVCEVIPKQSLQDGINSARDYIDIMEIDPECRGTLEAIQNYRQKFDKRLQVFLGVPEHDDYSHFADVVRYSSQALGHYLTMGSVDKTEEEKWFEREASHTTGFAL